MDTLRNSAPGLASLWAFEGRWTLSRRIRHKNGREDRLDGVAVFERSGPRLVQLEKGTLSVGGQVLEAGQRYLWAEADGLIEVSFSDNRPFHTIPLGDASPRTVHLCPPDRYEVAYDFTRWPRWSATWTVEGPRKDYVMVSEYRRTAE